MSRIPFLRGTDQHSPDRRRLLLLGGAGLLTLPPALLSSGCGGGGSSDDGDEQGSAYSGQYSGQANLSAGQVGRYLLTAVRSGNATGLMEIINSSNGGTTRADLRGTLDQNTGQLDVSGSLEELERQIPVALRGLLQQAGASAVRRIEVSVDNVTYPGSIAFGDGYPAAPGSGSNNGGSSGGSGGFGTGFGEGVDFGANNGTFSYTVNGTAITGNDTSALSNAFGNSRLTINLSTFGLDGGPGYTLQMSVPDGGIGTYTLGTDQDAQAVFGILQTLESYTTDTFTGTPDVGSIQITSVSDTTVQGSFSFRAFSRDFSNDDVHTVDITGTFTAAIVTIPVSP